MTGVLQTGLLIAIPGVAVNAWRSAINRNVPDPYLTFESWPSDLDGAKDEVFHVRQTQTYCNGHYGHWDPKITTPPGLYWFSWLLSEYGSSCRTESLRLHNTLIWIIALSLTLFVLCVRLNETSPPASRSAEDPRYATLRLRGRHVACNIALFPPVFFFSALYYTDVLSTTVTLMHFALFRATRSRRPSLISDVALYMLGMASLSLRQTNVFWVAVFPAALDIVEIGKRKSTGLAFTNSSSVSQIIRQTYNMQSVYDVPVIDAQLEDYFKVAISVGTAGIAGWTSVSRICAPHFALLASFVAFVVWNGSVVLGDKSNHTATMHTPQMLYIWPYMSFFSLPLMYTTIMTRFLPTAIRPRTLEAYAPRANVRYSSLTRLLAAIPFVVLGLVAVHFNTIVHPFTLADNRHYVFYVFRLLLRHPAIRYFAVPVYIFSGWAVIQTWGIASDSRTPEKDITIKVNDKPIITSKGLTSAQAPVTVSFALVWLATCTLNLVTAPLFEPRYLILPWIMWRLHVPSPALPPPVSEVGKTSGSGASSQHSGSVLKRLRSVLHNASTGDHRIWLETIWFLLINFVTCYIFINKGFAWENEPGKVQRFMW